MRGGKVFVVADCPPRDPMLTDRERMRRLLSRMELWMLDRKDEWEAELETGTPCLTFALGRPDGPRIPLATDPRTIMAMGAAAPLTGA